MKHFTQWIRSRGRSSSAPPAPADYCLEHSSNKTVSAITPENVPPFVIPGQRRKKAIARTQSDGLISHIRRQHPCKEKCRKAESVPCQIDTIAINEGLPNLMMETSLFGSTFVSGPAHTHRKESLLMDGLQILHQFQRKHANGEQHKQTAARLIPRPKKITPPESSSMPNEHYLDRMAQDLGDTVGSVLLSLTYNSDVEKLTVKPMQAKYQMSQLSATDCNSYIKVHLTPGKPMKKQTEVVRGSTTPTYTSVLTFSNVTKADLELKNVHVKVCNKMSSGLSRHNKISVLGEVVFPLSQLDLESCESHTTWRDIYSLRTSELQSVGWVKSCIDLNQQQDQLYVTVTEVAGLRFNRPASVYAVIDVHQDGGSHIYKKTQVKRTNGQPTFKETFAFSIEMEMMSSTQVNVKVMVKEVLRTDSIVGTSAITGTTCSERETFWNQYLSTVERQASQWTELYST